MHLLDTQYAEGLDSKLVYRFAFNRNRNVHVLDADPETCNSISTLFRLEGFEVETSSTIEQFLKSLKEKRIDVAVLNFAVHDENTLPLIEDIRALSTGASIFMVSDTPSVDITISAMRMGANDVLVKPIDGERLIDGVRNALRHQVQILPPVHGQRRVEVRGFSALTERERQVLQLLVDGKSNKETAIELSISARTVEVHRAHIMEKLGARNTADLIRIVLTS